MQLLLTLETLQQHRCWHACVSTSTHMLLANQLSAGA